MVGGLDLLNDSFFLCNIGDGGGSESWITVIFNKQFWKSLILSFQRLILFRSVQKI